MPRSGKKLSKDSPRPASVVYPMAVIELGTSAIRMAIGETDGVSRVRMLEQLVRGVSLGKDTFTKREIKKGLFDIGIIVEKFFKNR